MTKPPQPSQDHGLDVIREDDEPPQAEIAIDKASPRSTEDGDHKDKGNQTFRVVLDMLAQHYTH